MVIDLCVPWERSTASLAEAERNKILRYRPHGGEIGRYIDQSEQFGAVDGPISFHGVAIGARGGIQAATKRLLRSLGIGGGAVRVVQDMAIRDSIAMMNFIMR